MDDYKKWLSKELQKAYDKEKAQIMNYQETGNPRYQREQYNAEYLGRALSTALDIENGRNPKVDSCQRAFHGILDSMEKQLVTGDVDGALKTIQTYKCLGL